MIISKLEHSDFIYYDLHSEEVYSNYINNTNAGIYADRLTSNTLDRIIKQLDGDHNSKNIVFDFKNINAVQPTLNSNFNELLIEGYKIIFLNITKKNVEDIGYKKIDNVNNIKKKLSIFDIYKSSSIEVDGFEYFYLHKDNVLDIVHSNLEIFDEIFNNKFQEELKKCREDYTEPHSSSFVYLSSYFNIRKLISHNKGFAFYSIYKLAIRIMYESRQSAGKTFLSNCNIEEFNKPILVCQSLTSSYIVSILANMLNFDVLILDKIGPINKIYNTLNKNIIEDKDYIIVSDLVCLGTEIKIAKNIIQFLGGNYLGNVSLIKTETLESKHIYKENATLAIFSIDKTNNKELDYYISTNLESKQLND
ncbi:hypothetical protein EB1_17380 [Empedobacter brevis NBRC 14943 = ATCC 43319]|uniref:Uncharacterized protein n=1 Tax=Empedobacter brevis NBRC 14943 = ATCC 43319 TaxID=1218108 RepID=A0A511NHH2_9FLAO|nr:hypothetical protein [Empedobacter brevis]GEM51948.1 hypothetical protein EB1_17380 [Empedobacter brevis NBRC 14943 = ATCC 43319]